MNKTTTTIEIDLDVYKALNNQITYINEPFNDVLRRLILLKPVGNMTYDNNKKEGKEFYIISNKLGVSAIGIELPNGRIKVLKGSKFRKDTAPKFNGPYAKKREEVLSEDCLNSNFELKMDREFDSFAMAASIILGSSKNKSVGSWKEKQ